MEIKVKNYRDDLVSIHLPLVEKLYEGVFDSRGKQVMKYYDRTGRSDWLVNPVKIIKALCDKLDITGHIEKVEPFTEKDFNLSVDDTKIHNFIQEELFKLYSNSKDK